MNWRRFPTLVILGFFGAFACSIPSRAESELALASTPFESIDPRVWEESGLVEVQLEVTADGDVSRVEVLSASSDLLEVALGVAPFYWDVEPAEDDGTPSGGTLSRSLLFQNGFCCVLGAGEALEQFAMPKLLRAVNPSVFDPLPGNRQFVVSLDVGRDGVGSNVLFEKRNTIGAQKVSRSLDRLAFRPAFKNGQPVDCRLYFSVSHEGIRGFDQEITPGGEALPALARDFEFELPNGYRRLSGEVLLGLAIDSQGRVEKSEIAYTSHVAVGELTRNLVKGWLFEPAIEAGEARSVNAYLPFSFEKGMLRASRGRLQSMASELVPPRAIHRDRVVLPDRLSGVSGDVDLVLHIDPQGKVSETEVAYTSDSRLVEISKSSVSDWVFEPARRLGKPIAAKANISIIFNEGEMRSNANAVDVLPIPIHAPEPKLESLDLSPDEFALVLIEIDREGKVVKSKARDSSSKVLEQACLSAVLDWRYKPAIKNGQPVESSLVVPFVMPSVFR